MLALGIDVAQESAPAYAVVDLRLADGSEVSASTLLISTGVNYRTLDVPGAAALTGVGVYYGAARAEVMQICEIFRAKVVDVSHRMFRDFFVIANKIGILEEASRRGIEPIILFMVDPDA